MRRRIAVSADSGLIVFRDATVERPFQSDRQDERCLPSQYRFDAGIILTQPEASSPPKEEMRRMAPIMTTANGVVL